MRIPLDLYQILGVPMQAKPEQLQQAFEDRQQQLPRRQYTDAAIASRNQLLKQAYAVLAKEDARADYDRTLRLERSPTSAGQSELSAKGTEAVGLALADHQLVGGLLLLQDLGQYDTVLKLGNAYLNRAIDLNHVPTPSDIAEEDVVLSMALAYLELGREYWQQQEFAAAATALQQGHDLLAQENLFPEIHNEIQVDLHKLRPYQVLQLLSLDEEHADRQEGLLLLKDMLDQRGGIEGHDDDQSGLGIDDFLRFVQQLRSHLTVQEQLQLFGNEAQRPSAVASYLVSYALVAAGFSQGKPHHIQEARKRLSQLRNRQDTYIEQAMCSLLLGQPNQSVQTLTLSEDEESLAFIRQYSDEDEDDIPGLFLYTEHWLQQEVYPYFRDLVDNPVSLQNYFDDQHIQTALCALLPNAPTATPPTETQRTTNLGADPSLKSTLLTQARPSPPGDSSLRSDSDPLPTPPAKELPRDPTVHTPPTHLTAPPSAPSDTRTPTAVRRSNLRKSSRRAVKKSPLRWLPWLGAALLGLLSIGWVAAQIFRQNEEPPVASPTPSVTQPENTPAETPTPQPSSPSPSTSDQISTATARQVIESWQTIKAAGRGKDHNVEQFKDILANPMLSTWNQYAQADKSKNAYWEYELHQLEIQNVESLNDNQAIVYVQIEETGTYFLAGRPDPNQSYQKDQYRAKYELIKQQGEWRIKEAQAL